MKIQKILLGLLGCIALFVNAGAAWANIAGHIEFVHGTVQVTTTAGQTHALQKGDAINEGDVINSAKGASAQILMEDGGFIAVRQDTRMKIDSFKFSKKANEPEHSFFSLFKGGFRAITGLIGRVRHQDYKITTPAATIGIRGTDHETFFAPIALPGVPSGVYSKVNVGETSITTDLGTINVLPNQMGFAGGLNQIPQLQPLNTNIFTVVPAPVPEAGQQENDQGNGNNQGGEQGQQTAQGGTQEGGDQGSSDTDNGEPIRDTAVVDNTSQAGGTTSTAPTSTGTSTTTTTTVSQPTTTIPVTATSNTLTLNTTNQTVSSGTTTVSVQNGIYATAAQAAATAAATAAGATDFTLPPSASSASTAVSGASTAVSGASSLTIDTALASSNASSAQTAANAAATTATNAQTALTASGAFADSTAGPANTAVQNANTTLQTANTSVQTAATTVTTDNTNLTTAQAAANTALTAANSSLTTANTQLGNLSTEQSTLSGLISANATILATGGITVTPTTLQGTVTVAQQAATLAASLQTAGDFTNAQIAMNVAQSAASIVTYALAADTAIASATANAATASTQAGYAQAAATTGATDVGTTTSQLAVVNTNSPIVTTNAPIAAYNNPAVAGNFVGHALMSVAATPSGYNLGEPPSNPPQLNTTFVLDGNGNLVEARNMAFQVSDLQSGTAAAGGVSYASADITWTNGTAADTFKLADNSIYGGRWVMPTVTVTDNGTSAVTAYSPADSLWAVLLSPAVGYVNGLTGTATYTMAGHTVPFDSLGNLGTLNSASLTADFTNQLVSAAVNVTMGAGPMVGTFAVTDSNMPIQTSTSTNPAGFNSTGVVTATCTGTCTNNGAGGYSANLGGSFAGNAAASAGLGYNIWPTTTAGTPVTDLVQGLVAFTTGTAPTYLPGGPFAAYAGGDLAVEYTTNNFYHNSGLVAPPANVVMPVNNAGTGTQAVSVNQTASAYSGYYSFTDSFTVTNPATVTTLGSGTQFGANNYSSWGETSSYPLGGGYGAPPQWIVGPAAFWDTTNTGNTGATLTYSLDGSNNIGPVDSSTGTAISGTLDSATLTANLGTMLADATVGITMPVGGSTSYSLSSTGMTIGGSSPVGSFSSNDSNSTTVSVTAGSGCASGCYGSIDGALTGQNYLGAWLDYKLSDNSAGLYNTDGVAALVQASGPALNTGGTGSPPAYLVGGAYGIQQASNLTGAASTVTPGSAATVLTGFSDAGYSTTVTCTTCTATSAASNTTTGISFGTWDQGTFANTFSVNSPGTLFWITGAEPLPAYLAQVLTGSATYNLDSGAVGDMVGNAGTISSASLTANFNNQTMAVSLAGGAIGTATGGWSATTSNALMSANCYSSSGCFSADSYRSASQPGYLTVTIDGNSSTTNTSVSGQLSGQLVGNSLSGAIMSFSLNGPTGTAPSYTGYENIQGVAALSTTATLDPLTPYRIALALANDPLIVNGGSPMAGGFQNAASVTFDGSGNLTKLTDASSNSNAGAQTIALSGGTSGSAFTGASTATGTPCSPCTDATTGIEWGRWAPGVNATITVLATAGSKSMTVAGGGMHWITSPVLTGPVTLPISGTFAYTVAGGTNPTDSNGSVGTLNSASLSANFTAGTVDLGVNASVAGTTINGTAAGVPIEKKTATFMADSSNGLTVSCSAGTCASPQGQIGGGFGGTGAMGAVMMYGFLPNPAVSTNMITGAVALHR